MFAVDLVLLVGLDEAVRSFLFFLNYGGRCSSSKIYRLIFSKEGKKEGRERERDGSRM